MDEGAIISVLGPCMESPWVRMRVSRDEYKWRRNPPYMILVFWMKTPRLLVSISLPLKAFID
jgi:hypothetical protein